MNDYTWEDWYARLAGEIPSDNKDLNDILSVSFEMRGNELYIAHFWNNPTDDNAKTLAGLLYMVHEGYWATKCCEILREYAEENTDKKEFISAVLEYWARAIESHCDSEDEDGYQAEREGVERPLIRASEVLRPRKPQ